MVRAVKAAVIEPMSETWLERSTERSGQVLLLPALCHRNEVDSEKLALCKTGLIDLRGPKKSFRALVGNFSNRRSQVAAGQVLGVAEEYVPRPVCISTAEEDSGSSWGHVVRKSSSHLDVIQSEDLLATLRPFSSMWNGALGDITAVKHHIPTEGPPVSSQPYRVLRRRERTLIMSYKECSKRTSLSLPLHPGLVRSF